MSRPTPIGTRREISALAREGKCQDDIGVVRKNVNHILLRQAAIASLEPGKSSGTPGKTTASQ